ncbi:hypothetical protein DYBT9623_05181 [Dyadobacter sp. CECT 9623]|uniref:3-keto-alpha-glucoside-1,2-lyase/3-keto-2-hydroxy-glucal hydratase domain-containing protein n=1 Tax=Dyadobacter linearis TaxID=2823330 RepID=A0ABN7RGV3_9BACT|nr:DUF1080 domain-containing protein [Dyadobacter sp. CECT 9623]CAG5074494.1 hypothetical protein DYBT9623_05181 [Dyadobacter sp. CECT 9623]
MKTIIQKAFTALTIVGSLAACGNTGQNNSSTEETGAVNKEVSLSDSVAARQTVKFDFENYRTDHLPQKWSQFFTGSGGTDWKVIDDKGNKVLAQQYGDNPNNHFNIVVNDSIKIKDMILTVRLKGVSGKEDQGGGFVWRFTDKNNYYVVRANPLEDNVVLYKMENGKRSDLPLVGKGKTYGMDVDKLGSDWNTLKLRVEGSHFTVYLNDKELFKVEDKTFSNAGKIGLWTKADAVTYFDDLEIAHD